MHVPSGATSPDVSVRTNEILNGVLVAHAESCQRLSVRIDERVRRVPTGEVVDRDELVPASQHLGDMVPIPGFGTAAQEQVKARA
jgi:hypothetical protein